MYFFNTPNKLTIEVSTDELVRNVIRHLMTLYEHSSIAKKLMPLKYPGDYKSYELRLVDDLEDEWTPDMELGALKEADNFGRLGSNLAFIEKK